MIFIQHGNGWINSDRIEAIWYFPGRGYGVYCFGDSWLLTEEEGEELLAKLGIKERPGKVRHWTCNLHREEREKMQTRKIPPELEEVEED